MSSSVAWKKHTREKELPGRKGRRERGREPARRRGKKQSSDKRAQLPLLALLHGGALKGRRDSTTCAGFFSESDMSSRSSSFNFDDGVAVGSAPITPRGHDEGPSDSEESMENLWLATATSSSSSSSSWSTTDSGEWSEWEDDPMWVKDDLLLHPPRRRDRRTIKGGSRSSPAPPTNTDDPPSDSTTSADTSSMADETGGDNRQTDCHDATNEERGGTLYRKEGDEGGDKEEDARPMDQEPEGKGDRVWLHKSGIEALASLAVSHHEPDKVDWITSSIVEELLPSSSSVDLTSSTVIIRSVDVSPLPSPKSLPHSAHVSAWPSSSSHAIPQRATEEETMKRLRAARAKITRALTRRKEESEKSEKPQREIEISSTRTRQWRWSQLPKAIPAPPQPPLSSSTSSTDIYSRSRNSRRDLPVRRSPALIPSAKEERGSIPKARSASPGHRNPDRCHPDLLLLHEMIEEQASAERSIASPSSSSATKTASAQTARPRAASATNAKREFKRGSTHTVRIVRPEAGSSPNALFQHELKEVLCTRAANKLLSASANHQSWQVLPVHRTNSPPPCTINARQRDHIKEEGTTEHRKRSSSALARLSSTQESERSQAGLAKLANILSTSVRHRADSDRSALFPVSRGGAL